MYGIRLPHIFEIPSTSNVKPSISIEKLGFRSKNLLFQIKHFKMLGVLHTEFETLGISSEI